MNKNPNKHIERLNWGLIPYAEAWKKQEEIFEEIVRIKRENREKENPQPTSNYLAICQHPPVFTSGKSGKDNNVLFNAESLSEMGAEYFKINRGGDVTFHGPGQVVGYPLLDLENFFTDIHLYLRRMEEAVIVLLAEFGIAAGRYPGYTGVWIDPDKPGRERKICAMGVRCSRWVTMHGWALNVHNDLSYFSHIVPCGISDKQVTSMEKELGFAPETERVGEKLAQYFMEQMMLPLS
jgi:lipoyl(octanoyl) transferase